MSIRRRPTTGADGQVAEVDPDYQTGIIDNIVDLVTTLQQGLTLEEQLMQRGDLWRLTAQRKENADYYNQIVDALATAAKEITIPELKDRLKREVLVPWEAIKKRMEEMRNQNPRFTADQVQEYLNRVKKAFDEENWQGVESEARNFRDQSKNGVHVEDDAKDLVQKIFELQRQAKIIDAFYKRKLDISGILYSPRQQSVAIVNGKQMMVGDALDAEGTITCVEIGEDYVVFETEGVEIKIGQKSGKTK